MKMQAFEDPCHCLANNEQEESLEAQHLTLSKMATR